MNWKQWLHSFLAAVWVGLGYPTVVYWKESILWLAFMSLYTIVWLHVDGVHASKDK